MDDFQLCLGTEDFNGTPHRRWGIGFSTELVIPTFQGRRALLNSEGNSIYAPGFARVCIINQLTAIFMYENQGEIAEGSASIWKWVRRSVELQQSVYPEIEVPDFIFGSFGKGSIDLFDDEVEIQKVIQAWGKRHPEDLKTLSTFGYHPHAHEYTKEHKKIVPVPDTVCKAHKCVVSKEAAEYARKVKALYRHIHGQGNKRHTVPLQELSDHMAKLGCIPYSYRIFEALLAESNEVLPDKVNEAVMVLRRFFG